MPHKGWSVAPAIVVFFYQSRERSTNPVCTEVLSLNGTREVEETAYVGSLMLETVKSPFYASHKVSQRNY